MIVKMIKGCTRVLGKSQGFLGLPVRDELINEAVMGPTPAMVTSWEPTPDEISRIGAGAPIIVKILGTAHPPIIVEAGEIPE